MIKKISYLLAIAISISNTVFAQPSLKVLKESSDSIGTSNFLVSLNSKQNTQATIKLSSKINISQQEANDWVGNQLKFRPATDELRYTGKKTTTKDNWEIEHLQQFYKGIKVEFANISILSYNKLVKVIQAEFYPIDDNFETRPSISSANAFQKAKDHIGATKYIWEGYIGTNLKFKIPEAGLVIIEDRIIRKKMVLCYKITMYAIQPQRYCDVFVNATSGEIVFERNLQHQPLIENEGFQSRKLATSHSEKNEIINTNSQHSFDNIKTERIPKFRNTILTTATGNTRYSGVNDFETDDGSNEPGRPYQLRAFQFNFLHDIITLNYGLRDTQSPGSDDAATDFTDDDNLWNEYPDVNNYTLNSVKSGVDVHFNMQLISEYWQNKQGRNSWDDNGGQIKSYVHATLNFGTIALPSIDNDNAYWSSLKEAMYFGDGSYSRTNPLGQFPLTALDVSGHELGHAVTSKLVNGGLVYETESGALNEGFSDIWGACIENYFNEKFDNNTRKEAWTIGEEFDPVGKGFRNFKNPKSSASPAPDTYQKSNWASTVPNPPPYGPGQGPYDGRNDNGGVHGNSSILLKWFSLITDGGSGTNDNNFQYNIQGIGFDKAELLAYKMEGMLTSNADYSTARNVCMAVAESIVGNDMDHPLTEENVREIREAWQAVGLGENIIIYNETNSPGLFSSNSSFTTIAVGKNNQVWAGTNKLGLYISDGSIWTKSTSAISNYEINDIKADKAGGIWIAESGRGFDNFNAGGGVYYYPDTTLNIRTFYDDNKGIASRYVSGIYIDTSKNFAFPSVKASERFMYFVNSTSEYKSGKVSSLTQNGTSFYTLPEISGENGTDGFSTLAGNNSEIWAYSTKLKKVIKFTNNVYNGFFDRSNISDFPSNIDFYVNAIYFDKNNNKWLGLADSSAFTTTGGIVVLDNADGIWKLIPPTVLPNPSNVFANSIAGDTAGRVYFGTDSGLVIYNGLGISDTQNYLRLTTNDGLPSNKIRGICIDTLRGGVWLATPKGIIFYKSPTDTRSIAVAVTQSKCPNAGVLKIDIYSTPNFYDPSNKYIVELSDANGNFSNPVTLGTINATPGGVIHSLNANLPANLPLGKNYIVAVKSTMPQIIGQSGPINPKFAILPTTPSLTSFAAYECIDGDWTNYYDDKGTANTFDDILLLSIKKNGNIIGTLNSNLFVKIATTANAGSFVANQITGPNVISPFWSMNRYWDVSVLPANEPLTNVGIRFYYTDNDLFDVNAAQPGNPVTHSKLVFFKTDGDPDPSTNLSGNTYIRSIVHENGISIPGATWEHTDLGGGNHMAEFEVSSFSGGGGGVSLSGGAFTYTKTFSISNGNWSNPATWSTGIIPTMQTDVEITHAVMVDIDANCKSLKVEVPGNINVTTGKNLRIFN